MRRIYIYIYIYIHTHEMRSRRLSRENRIRSKPTASTYIDTPIREHVDRNELGIGVPVREGLARVLGS